MRDFFSDNPLYTRQDAVRAAADLIRPLVSCMTPGKGRVMIGSGSAHYSEDVAGMEGFSRALWALVPMLLGKCPEAKEFWPLWQEGIRRGTDPEDPEYWGDICQADQRMVEMAVIGIGLCFAREYFYDSLLPMEQDRLIAWLNQINLYDMPKNNWRFFRILVNIGFRKVGRAADEKRLKEDLDLIESHYAGDGWYFDYPARRDYYTLWGFHFYSLLYAAAMRGEDPDRCARFEERAKRIAPRFACWFDREGRGLPYGRSLTYRFAQSSFWSAMAFAGITAESLGWGEIKGLVLRNLRFWLSMPIFDRGGALTVGYGYPNLCVAEGYNAPGSPYWALKTFSILALPENHPFWQAEEKPYTPPPVFPDTQARLLLTRDPENRQVIAYTAGNHACEHMHGDEKYEKFAYSTQFGFSVARETSALSKGGFDSMLAVKRQGRDLWQGRSGCTSFSLKEDRLHFEWSPTEGVQIKTTIAPLGMWHIRKHRIRTEMPIDISEGAFAVRRDWPGCRPCDRVSSVVEADETHAQVHGEFGTSAIIALAGYEKGETVWQEPNTNLMYSRTWLPTLLGSLPAGEHTLLCAVFADAGNAPVREIPEKVMELAHSLYGSL